MGNLTVDVHAQGGRGGALRVFFCSCCLFTYCVCVFDCLFIALGNLTRFMHKVVVGER